MSSSPGGGWRHELACGHGDCPERYCRRGQDYILFALVLPLALSILFKLVFPSEGDPLRLTVAVYDPGSSRLTAGLLEQPEVKLLRVDSPEALTRAVEEEAVGGLLVPAGFDAAVEAGTQPTLAVYVNVRRGGGALTAFRGLVQQQVWKLVDKNIPARIVEAELGALPGMTTLGRFRLDHYLLVVMLVMALALAGVFAVPYLLIEEKEKHTLEALLVSPAGPAEVAAGKAITGMVYSLLISGILIVLNRGWTGSWPLTGLALLLGTLLMVAVGLLTGSFFRTTMQLNTWSSVIMLALMLPSWLPAMQMPAILETTFRLIPTCYLVDAVNLALAGEVFSRIWIDLAVLAGCVGVAFALVVWRLRREER